MYYLILITSNKTNNFICEITKELLMAGQAAKLNVWVRLGLIYKNYFKKAEWD